MWNYQLVKPSLWTYTRRTGTSTTGMKQEESSLFNRKRVLFLHDNTTPHVLLVARDTIRSLLGITVQSTLRPGHCANIFSLLSCPASWEIIRRHSQNSFLPRHLIFTDGSLSCWRAHCQELLNTEDNNCMSTWLHIFFV